MKRGMRLALGVSLALGLGLPGMVGGLFWWAGSGATMKNGEGPIFENPSGPTAPSVRPDALRVLSWNIHYGVGPKDDAGNLRSREEVLHWLGELAKAIREVNPDLLLLQETDFDSKRTHGIDQMRWLATELGYRYMAPTVTWDKNYVPHPAWPPSQHYGPMTSGQCVLSRFPIITNRHLALPQPDENPWWYNRFYLNRMVQRVEIDVAGTRLGVFNIHNEAFNQKNRELHARLVADWVHDMALPYRLVAGDFNAIPPEATLRKAFPDEPETDMTTDRSIQILRDTWAGWGEVYPEQATRADESKSFSFPAHAPNRRLDYLWFSPAWYLVEGGIRQQTGAKSDHLPSYALLRFTPPEEKAANENNVDSSRKDLGNP